MPTVPYPAGPRVQPTATPQVRVSPQASAAAFGGVDSTVDIQPAARELTNVLLEHKRQADQIALTDSAAQVAAAKNALLKDALSQEGKNAFDLPERISQGYQEAVTKIQDGLSGDYQKGMFGHLAANEFQDLDLQVQRHVAQQRKVYDAQTTDALIANKGVEAVANYTDAAVVDQAIAMQRAVLTDFGARAGWSPEKLQDELATVTSKTRLGVVNQYLDNGEQDLAAQAYFERHRADFIGSDLTQAEKLTEAGASRAQARSETTRIMAAAPTLSDAMKLVDDIADPKVADRVEQKVRQAFADRAADERQKGQEAFARARQVLEETGDLDKIPRSDWAQIPESDARYLTFREREIHDRSVKTDPDVLMSLKNAAGLHADKFMGLDLSQYKDKLSPKDYAAMQNKQLSMRLGESTHDTRTAEAETRRTAHQAESDARAKQKAKEKQDAKDAAARKLLESMGVHLGPKVPGGPLPTRGPSAPITAPTAPGRPKPNGTPGGIDLTRPAVPEGIENLDIPDTWKDEAAINPDYADYLVHHVNDVDEGASE